MYLAQEDQLSDILTEVRALRALVLAQGHRIDVLERQLTRIEDGEVWRKLQTHTVALLSFKSFTEGLWEMWLHTVA